MSIQVCLISWINFNYMKNGGKKAFLVNPKINIMYPKVGNIIVVPITKRMQINMSIHVCLISRMKFDHKENGGKKAFLGNPKHQYRVSQYGNMVVVPITKKIVIILCIHVCLISRMNFNYMKNGGKKAFPANPKHHIMYPNVGNMIVMPITKRMEIIMSVQVCLIS